MKLMKKEVLLSAALKKTIDENMNMTCIWLAFKIDASCCVAIYGMAFRFKGSLHKLFACISNQLLMLRCCKAVINNFLLA
jgi:hypothetical protein